MKKLQKNNNPHSYRGLICKNSSDTRRLTTSSGQETEYDNEYYSADDRFCNTALANDWHPQWYSYFDDDGVLHPGYENYPWAKVKRGFEFFIHGYRATMKKVMTDGEWFKLFSSLKSRYGGGFTLQSTGIMSGIFWTTYYCNTDGVRIYVNRKTESVNDIPEFHLMVETDGKHCERKGVYGVGCDIVWLYSENGFKMTRVDPKVRDCESRLTIPQLESWRNRGHVRGVRQWEETRCIYHHFPSIDMVIASPKTIYFGKRISSKCLRIYEPHVLHHASGLDWEVEYSRGYAEAFAKKLSDCIVRCRDDKDIPYQFFEMYVAREFCKVIADSVFTAINIIEKNGKSRDYDRLPEYQSLIDAVFSYINGMPVTFYTPTKLKPTRLPLPTIDSKITWLFKQVAPTLYAVLKSFDDAESETNFMRSLLEDGKDRISRYLKSISDQGMKTPPDIEGELRRLEVMEMLPAV